MEFNFKLNPLVESFKVRLCFDIEANGLLKEVSEFFCAVTENVDNGEIKYYKPDEWKEFLKDLSEADWIIGHNIIGYDIPALTKLYGWLPSDHTVIYDTLIASRIYNANLGMHEDCPRKVMSAHTGKMKNIGPHTLMNLGYIVGEHKDSFGEDKAFHEYCDEMLPYCAQDVKVNVKIFHWLVKRLKTWSPISVQLEMEVAKYITQQMQCGWFFNIEAADAMYNSVEEEVHRLEDVVREAFPPIYKPKLVIKEANGRVIPKTTQPRVKANGELSSVGLKNLYGIEWEYIFSPPLYRRFADRIEYYSGEFTPIVTEEFNLGSRTQIAERMQRIGWIPTSYTDKGNIIVNDEALESMGATGIPEGVLLQEYFKATKILSMVKSWMDHYDWDTGCIHGYVNSVGAVTSRMTHSNPNVAQVPSSNTVKVEGLILKGGKLSYSSDKSKKSSTSDLLMTFDGGKYKKGDLVTVDNASGKPKILKYASEFLRSSQWSLDQFSVAAAHGDILLWGKAGNWGADCRDLFGSPEGRTIVGADMSGLELRALAHYMNDDKYTDLILNGDIHSYNMELAGLPTRNNAKTFI
jgi:DNA polymerase I